MAHPSSDSIVQSRCAQGKEPTLLFDHKQLKIIETRFLPPLIASKWRGLRGLVLRGQEGAQFGRADLAVRVAVRGGDEAVHRALRARQGVPSPVTPVHSKLVPK